MSDTAGESGNQDRIVSNNPKADHGRPSLDLDRVRRLEESGLSRDHALQTAYSEYLLEVWRHQEGMWLDAHVYGDFYPPSSEVAYPDLGIQLSVAEASAQEEGARGTIRARISVSEKSVAAVTEAHDRLSDLLGLLNLTSRVNGALRFRTIFSLPWGAGFSRPDYHAITGAIARYRQLPPVTRRRVSLALYWFRSARPMRAGANSGDTMVTFDGWWNAFEVLVDAYCDLLPVPKRKREEVEDRLNELLSASGGVMTVNLFDDMRREVSIGFPDRARHVLRSCFDVDGERYAEILFESFDGRTPIYRVRNRIKHGSVTYHDPGVQAQVYEAVRILWVIVMRLFAAFLGTFDPTDAEATP